MSRLRATKHQRCASAPGGSSDTTAPRAATAAWRPALVAGYGTCALPASTPTVLPAAASAPAWAAESMPMARPDTTVTPAADRPAPERAGDVEPVVRGAPRADDRDAVLRVRAPTSPRTCRTAGGSARSRSRAGYSSRQRQTVAEARCRGGGAGGRRVEAGVAAPHLRGRRRARAARRPPARARAARGAPLELELQPPGEGRDQRRPAQAVVARRGHAARPGAERAARRVPAEACERAARVMRPRRAAGCRRGAGSPRR